MEIWSSQFGHVTVKEIVCTPDIELLAVGLRPYYLPREYTCAIVVVVYIPPSTNTTRACDVIHSSVASLQTAHSGAFLTINGDFNHAKLPKTLTGFTQYVKCSTRENKILDKMYANVEDAYSSTALPPLGSSDHNLVHLVSTYKPVVRRQPPITRTIQLWSGEIGERMQDNFQITDWDLLKEDYREDVEGLAKCFTLYVQTCEESIVPTKKVCCFPNNKPWINKNIKALLNRKKRAFMAKDREGVKSAQKELNRELRRAKKTYKDKIESKLEANSSREVWNGLKRIKGQKRASQEGGGNVRTR